MAVVSQSIFDNLLKQKAIAADGKSVITVSCDGNRYPEGEVFTVEKAVVEKPPNPPKEVKDATNPSNG
jgi:hypothetical protein